MANRQKKISAALFLVISSALLLFLVRCSTVEERKETDVGDKGQFSLFFNGPDRASLDITFDVSAINIISEEGVIREIDNTPVSINSIAIKGSQVFLTETSVPVGKYTKLQFIVERAYIKRKGETVSLALPPEGFEIDVNVSIVREQNVSLFLRWDADASFVDGYLFKPVTAVEVETPELETLLVYVTNEGSNNVSVIDRHTGEVIATIMVGERPRGIAVAFKREQSRIYVANSGSNNVSVIDPATNEVENEISIRYGRSPEAIAIARLTYDSQTVFVTNYDSDSVSIINTEDFQEKGKVDVGQGPIAIAVDPDVETLSGTRFLDFEEINIIRNYREKYLNVYVANENSNNVSVIVFDILKGESINVIDLEVEWSPVALDVDYQRGKVYVANYKSQNLSVIDIVEVIKGNISGAVSTINNVGNFITGIISDPVFDRIYLLKKIPGEIIIIRPFSEGFDALRKATPPVMGTIAVGDAPQSFLLDSEARMLYVINRGSNNVSVVDKAAKTEKRIISVGRKPYGVTIFRGHK